MESIKVNLIPNGAVSVCHASQYDIGRQITLELYEGLTPYVLQSGDEVQLNLRKPDNTVITAGLTVTPTNDYVILTTTEQMTAVYGQVLCELRLTNGGNDIGTANFIMQVEPDVLSNGVPSASVIRDLDAQVAELVQEDIGDNFYTKEQTDTLLDAKANASDVYTKSQTYTKTETDGLLANKANSSDVYTKSATDSLLDAKANASDVYTKSATDTLLEGKADTEGEYDGLTVGNAKQLVATVGETDKTPYLFRTAGGSIDIGDRETDELVGGSVAFNQIQPNQVSYSGGGITFSYADNKLTVSGTATETVWWLGGSRGVQFDFYKDHVYLFDVGNEAYTQQSNAPLWYMPAGFGGYAPQARNRVIKKCETTAQTWLQYQVPNGYSFANPVTFMPQIFDLTAMFGATIADYIYSLEQATAGAGVAWFKRLFNKPYYAYNAGELMSVKTSGHKLTGFNAWDEVWEIGAINDATGENQNYSYRIRSKNYIPCLPNTSYYYNLPSGSGLFIAYYDANKNYISGGWTTNQTTHNTPENAYFIRFTTGDAYGTTYHNDICINLSWDGERDGEYEPYEVNTYPLDSDLELRGIPKLDANNKLYYDGDTYSSDGAVKRRFGFVDLGSLTWAKGSGYFFTESITDYKKPENDNIKGNAICDKYSIGVWAYDVDKTITFAYSATKIGIVDANYNSYTAEAFKTAMSGVYLVYELAEPTTEQAEPFTNPQIVNDFGTEEYIDNRAVAIPVGHNTFYEVNLRAKLEMSPDSPESNGDYLMRHTSEGNAYTPYISPVPTAPTADGTYTLKAVVSSGQATLAWVLDE